MLRLPPFEGISGRTIVNDNEGEVIPITGRIAAVGVDSCIAWLYEEPKVGGEARFGKTLLVPAHRPHQGPSVQP